MANDTNVRESLLRTFIADKPLAHKMLFPHRHKDETPDFHKEIIHLLNSASQLVVLMAFRGAAKSTLVEEYILCLALFEETKFVLIVGSSWALACERLAAVRREIETNDTIMELFGDQKATPWSADEIVLANGVKIKAIGAGQSMRGVKHNQYRPDVAVIDDLEDEENVRTDDARHKMDRWLVGTLRPAMHPTKGKIRFIGTPLHPKSLIQRKLEDTQYWTARHFPIIYTDLETGEEKSSWPSRFPLDVVCKMRDEYAANGNLIEFNQEYMCRAEDIAGKPFKLEMIKTSAIMAKGHDAIYIFCDPARTVNAKTSARTGYVAWSWRGNRLTVHEAFGAFHKPDEIVKTLLELDEKYKPVHIGVELNGLEEFIAQPLRAAQVTAGRSIPFVGVHAPRDKLGFILGLQPFYAAGDVIHAKHLPDLEQELLQYPTGRNDVINSLAYALMMRPGRPVYEDFTEEHIAVALELHPASPRYLVVSSRPAMTAAALVQYIDGTLRIYQDWVRTAPPQEALEQIYHEAILTGGQVKLFSPDEQFDKYNNYGIPAAAKRLHAELQRTPSALKSEGKLGDYMRKQVRGVPGILIHERARWAINGLSGGYARKIAKGGVLADHPTDDQYRLVVESIESFISFLGNRGDEVDSQKHYAYTNTGRRFLSSLPSR